MVCATFAGCESERQSPPRIPSWKLFRPPRKPPPDHRKSSRRSMQSQSHSNTAALQESNNSQREITRVSAFDDGYAMPLAVTIRSVLDHLAGDRCLRLYILDG